MKNSRNCRWNDVAIVFLVNFDFASKYPATAAYVSMSNIAKLYSTGKVH